MNTRYGIISLIGLLYFAFWQWYTGAQKPLTAEEIETYMQKLKGKNGDERVLARIREFLESDTGKGFVMVNMIQLYPTQPGVESPAKTLSRYTSVFLPAILKRASHPIALGQTAAEAVEAWGIDNGTQWTSVGLVRYRSRRDMIESATMPIFTEIHPYKTQSMAKTIAVPVDPWFSAGDPRLIFGLLAMIFGLLVLVSFPQKKD